MENKEVQSVKKRKRKKGLNNIPRKGVERGFAIISLMIIVPIFFVAALLMVILPRPEVSEIEKRKLAGMPEFTFDSYFSNISVPIFLNLLYF